MSWDDALRVAVSQRVAVDPTHGERRDGLAQGWVDCFRALHIVPVLIPNDVELASEVLAVESVDAVLLTGGNDILRPGTEPDEDAAPERDATEQHLIETARAAEIPLVGVCRGAQFLNLFFGGSLRDDQLPRRHVAKDHGLRVVIGDYEEHFEVNSFHRWVITTEDLAGELDAFGWSEDGCVELFAHPTDALSGMMWHPERPGPATPSLDSLLGQLLRGRTVAEALVLSHEVAVVPR
jgi:N5-(cytidine 5'-diphosphoramidyl)-L-glutamine hydrolase